MTIKVSEDGKLVALEFHKSGTERFWTCSDFASCTVCMDEFLDELERNKIIPPRARTTEHQAQGLLEMVWGDGECGR